MTKQILQCQYSSIHFYRKTLVIKVLSWLFCLFITQLLSFAIVLKSAINMVEHSTHFWLNKQRTFRVFTSTIISHAPMQKILTNKW